MSQSPILANAPAEQVSRYQNGWRAISRLIAQGRSFSGHERNCCFLNIGDGRFADVSAATSLDLLDDGRAVAVVDWDHDGKLDLWVTNRNSPRVRFLKNETNNQNHFLSVRLEGVTCNRDAIGARLELYITGLAPRMLTKELRAGDGYLAQSSKSIHFGLKDQERVDRLVVRWPGGKKEKFTGLVHNHHYKLVQGTGVSRQWSPAREPPSIEPKALNAPVENSLRRTVITGKVLLPPTTYRSWSGESIPLDQYRGKPLLISLWSASCRPCLKELALWSKFKTVLSDANLDVLALNIDDISQRDDETQKSGSEILSRLKFAYSSGIAGSELIQTLELMHFSYIELKQPLPLPCSFLLDSQGRLSVIYKGPLSVEQLLADVHGLSDSPSKRRDSAVPFSGRWLSEPFMTDPRAMVKNLLDAERPEYAARYLQECIRLIEESQEWETLTSKKGAKHISKLYNQLGKILLDRKKQEQAKFAFTRAAELDIENSALFQEIGEAFLAERNPIEALNYLSQALRLDPNNPKLLYNVGISELALRKRENAINHLRLAVKLLPEDMSARFQLANAVHSLGETQEAVDLYREILQLQPNWPFAANNLAWILATHPDAKIRNGIEAVTLAERLNESSGQKDPVALATLAAAYAEVGRYEDAVKANNLASSLSEKLGDVKTVEKLQERNSIFKNKQPLREKID